MARKTYRKKYRREEIQISKGKFDRVLRNHRCTVIGRDEGGSTFKCGKQIVAMDSVNNRYYRITGSTAMYSAYVHKHRSRRR